MIDISISVEGWQGLNWPRWQRLIAEVEALGFAGLYLSDHFNISDAPDANSLELVVALTYLADHTQRVHFGSMVSPLSVRDPVLLARQAAAIDDLSGGRMILGLGAGWHEAEHSMYGYELGDIPARMDRFAEGMAVIAGLLRGTEPFSYEGRFYRLRNAHLAGPRRPGRPPILVGGSGPKRTLPLVARYADIWNGQLETPDEFRQSSALLDRLIVEAGRQPEDVKRTITLPLFCGRTAAELERRARWLRGMNPDWTDVPIETVFASLRPTFKSLTIGSPAEVIRQIRAYGQAGVSELVIQWADLDDIEGLHLLREEVIRPLASG
jgi:alkanesulfonate monooxygenase SsuD/methylene tetrahydromethanopterin reductase-like flavin-dependent oxidoreductase (luciferase family)